MTSSRIILLLAVLANTSLCTHALADRNPGKSGKLKYQCLEFLTAKKPLTFKLPKSAEDYRPISEVINMLRDQSLLGSQAMLLKDIGQIIGADQKYMSNYVAGIQEPTDAVYEKLMKLFFEKYRGLIPHVEQRFPNKSALRGYPFGVNSDQDLVKRLLKEM